MAEHEYDVVVDDVEAMPTAVSRATTTFPDLAATIQREINRVYDSLGTVSDTGHNIVRYDGDEPTFSIEVGVLLNGPFAATGDVVVSTLPAGRVARTVHRGEYRELHRAHVAIRRWCDDNGEKPAGPNWEIYGDWADDPADLTTEVFYLLT